MSFSITVLLEKRITEGGAHVLKNRNETATSAVTVPFTRETSKQPHTINFTCRCFRTNAALIPLLGRYVENPKLLPCSPFRDAALATVDHSLGILHT